MCILSKIFNNRLMCIIINNDPEKKIEEDAQGPKMTLVILCTMLLFLRIHTTKYFINISENPESEKLDSCRILIPVIQDVFQKF